MRYVDEYRDKGLIKKAAEDIAKAVDKTRGYSFMEVCGTHTAAIARFGLKALLAPNINLISGPGCPVCVTDERYVDTAVACANIKGTIIATFGDMVKVPGSASSLEETRAKGARVTVVYSPTDALTLARENPQYSIIFLGVGFETTAPAVAATIKEAKKDRVRNFFVFSGHKVMPPALSALVKDKGFGIDGFILPAHVSAIIGSRPYDFIPRDYGIPCVIAGFEPLDIIQGVYMLIRQISQKRPKVEIQYDRVVKPEGNRLAQKMLDEVFEPADAQWRGLGTIRKSGLAIRREFSDFDSERHFKIKLPERSGRHKDCICGEVLKGKSIPKNCRYFKKACTPEHPIGPCMVSSEGTCSAAYLYNN